MCINTHVEIQGVAVEIEGRDGHLRATVDHRYSVGECRDRDELMTEVYSLVRDVLAERERRAAVA